MPLLMDTLMRGKEGWTPHQVTAEELICLPAQATRRELLIFLPLGLLSSSSASIPTREGLSKRFLIPTSFWNPEVQGATGFFGCDTDVDKDEQIASCRSWFRFMIKHAQYHEHRSDGDISYAWYKVSVFTYWSPSESTILCFDFPPEAQDSLQKSPYRLSPESPLLPYSLHARLVEEVIKLFDKSVWSLRDYIRRVELTRKAGYDPSSPPEPNFVHLHELSRHVLHSSETLNSAMYVLQSMIKQIDVFTEDWDSKDKATGSAVKKIKMSLLFQLSVMNCIELRSRALEERLKNEISLAYNTVAQYDSKITVNISKTALADSTTMRTISVLGLLFLPPTFIAAIFSMSFFDYSTTINEETKQWTVSDKFWVYWVVAVPITAVTVLCWWRFKPQL